MDTLSLEQARMLTTTQRCRLRRRGIIVPHVPIPGKPKTGSTRSCVVCGKDVYQYPNQIRKYCSWKCRDIFLRSKRVNEADGIARCARCKIWKPIANFIRGSGGRPHSYCKTCSSQWFHERRGTPVEQRRPYKPRGLLTPEERYRNHLANNRRYRQKNGHKVRMWNKLRFHRQRAAGGMPDRFDIGRMICEQDARCTYCGTMLGGKYHIDHKKPVSRGGTNHLKNLQLLCATCNLRKHTMTHEEFLVSKKHMARQRD